MRTLSALCYSRLLLCCQQQLDRFATPMPGYKSSNLMGQGMTSDRQGPSLAILGFVSLDCQVWRLWSVTVPLEQWAATVICFAIPWEIPWEISWDGKKNLPSLPKIYKVLKSCSYKLSQY